MQCAFLVFLESAWEKPDDGIWETRSGARHFTESKVAAWVAFDRAVKLVEADGLQGPLEKWRELVTRFMLTFASTASTANGTASCSIMAQRARRGVAASAADWFFAR